MRVDIKPLSVNEAWRGRRFKTPEYRKYERDILTLPAKAALKTSGTCNSHPWYKWFQCMAPFL